MFLLLAGNIRICVILHIYLLYDTYKSNGFFGFKKDIVSFKGVVHYTFNGLFNKRFYWTKRKKFINYF